MKILILNWKQGENNPFNYFNSKIKESFDLLGCIVSIIEIDNSLFDNINKYPKFDLAITWQGIGSNISIHNDSNLWENLEIPLVCLHGDHPCYRPTNHTVDNSFVHHVYAAPSFANYANTFFKKSHPALYYPLPNIFYPAKLNEIQSGNFFVFPKNLDPTKATLTAWKRDLKPQTSNFLIEGSEQIIAEYESNICKDHHSTINELFTRDKFDEIRIENNNADETSLFHYLHGLLDGIYRNYASEQVINLLQDYPLKIYGRGWDNFKEQGNNNHQYFEFGSLASGDFQFYSNYGIIDIAPSFDFFHDRLLRACAHKGAFITSSLISHSLHLEEEFHNIFYRMNNNNLLNTVEKIVTQPEEHLDICRKFSKEYQRISSFYNFYLFISQFCNFKNR